MKTFILILVIPAWIMAVNNIKTKHQMYKINEKGNKPITARICGDAIIRSYDWLCRASRKRKALKGITLINH